jgi:exonuclease III
VYRSGALQNLIQVTQDYKINLLAVQEVRWRERSIIEKKFCVIYYGYDDKHKIFGTAVLVRKRIRSRVIDFKSIDKRMCAIRIRVNLKTVAASVPMHQRRKGVKVRRNQFYERLERTYKQCPS